MTHPPEIKNKFIEMRAEGHTLTAIAKDLGIARNTAVNWSKEFVDEIAVGKSLKTEEMKEKYGMTTEKEIEMFGEMLLAIRNELATRDLRDVPANKLVDMMLKISEALEAKIPEPTFLTEDEIWDNRNKREYVEWEIKVARNIVEGNFVGDPCKLPSP